MGTMLTSTGDHERSRIVRQYFPMGDPAQMQEMALFARKYGLSMPANTVLAGHVYHLWNSGVPLTDSFYQADGGPPAVVLAETPIFRPAILGLGLIVAAIVVFVLLKKK